MKRPSTLKTRKDLNCSRGYTLLELAIVLAIIGIMGMVGSALIAPARQKLLRSAESLAGDLESYMAMTHYSPNSYSITFERGGYTVLRNRQESIEIEKEVKYPESVEFARVPANMSFQKNGDLKLKKEDMTIKILDRKKKESLYITIVPVSNRVRVTASPSKPI